MVDEIKDPPAAIGGGDKIGAGTGTPAATVDAPKPGETTPKPEATSAEDAAKMASEKAAAEKAEADSKAQAEKARAAAEVAEKEKLEKEEKEKLGKGDLTQEQQDKIAADKAAAEKAEVDAKALAEKTRKETWEKLRKDGGIVLNDDQLLAIDKYAEENKLDNAAKAIVMHQQNQTLVQQKEAWAQSQKQWLAELQADKEFGGKNFPENSEGAKRVFTKYADPEFVKMMQDTGMGNHPGLLKTFARIHRELMAPDSFVSVEGGGGNREAKKTAEQVLFPHSSPDSAAIE